MPARREALRSWTACTLVVIGCLLAPLAVVGTVLRNEILDVDDFASVVIPLGEDPAIQRALVVEVGPEVVRRVDSVAAGLVAIDDVEVALTQLLASDAFASTWETIVRAAHPQIRQVLLGRDTDVLQTSDGKVQIDLAVLGREVQQRLVAAGFDIAGAVDLGGADLNVNLYHSDALARVQEGTDRVVRLAPIAAIGAVVALVAAVVVAPRRARIVWWGGLGLLAGALAVGALLALGRLRYLDALDGTVPDDAAEAAYEIVAHPFVVAVRWWFVVALVLLVAGAVWSGWLARRVVHPARWLVRHRLDLAMLLVGVGFGVVLWWHHPTLSVLITVATLVVAGVLAIAVLGRRRAIA